MRIRKLLLTVLLIIGIILIAVLLFFAGDHDEGRAGRPGTSSHLVSVARN